MSSESRISFGTKAETLERLQPLLTSATVPDLIYFTVLDFRMSGEEILAALRSRFGSRRLVVRSSAFNEDGAGQSMAGAFRSCLNVDGNSLSALRAAIEEVIASYAGNPRDQVLVQSMLEDVAVCGVIMTHDLNSGAPYYILNYDDESGKTDRITGGTGVNKTVVVYRDYDPAQIESARVGAMLAMTRELETLCGEKEPLDIEFAITGDGKLHLLQVRRITVQKNWNRNAQTLVSGAIRQITHFFTGRSLPRPGPLGTRTMLGQMPDWNPAEIIGVDPRPLAVSLYRRLVTDSIWQEARARMGYRALPNETLMVALAGHPYIDVRNSFNSFLPADLDEPTGHALVNAWLDRLTTHPEFHDKVEFQVAQTVLDFCFNQEFEARYAGTLTQEQQEQYRLRLQHLTRANVTPAPNGNLHKALMLVEQLERLQANKFPEEAEETPSLWRVVTLLDECRRLGTLPFAIIARHAFMAEALLRSAVARGALAQERLEAFKRSLVTVAGELAHDFHAVMTGTLERSAFLARYGHLRPGTYDILSLRYDQRADLFRTAFLPLLIEKPDPFELTVSEREGIARLIGEAGLNPLTPETLMEYAGTAIVHRERSKFVFTRHLSDILEQIARWGEGIGLNRDDLSYLTLDDIQDTLNTPFLIDQEVQLNRIIAERRQTAELTRGIRLGYILRDERDICIVPLHRNAPNFVTSRRIEGQTVLLDGRMSGQVDLYNKIVCIENADPGFDWVFTRGIAGLISKFGGANSHMTIRCAELGLPAAIGVGEQTFERLVQAGTVELNCRDRIVRPVVAAPFAEEAVVHASGPEVRQRAA